MNNDLISKSALLKKAVNFTEYDEGGWDMRVLVIRAQDVEEAPAVDAAPVRHGYWKGKPIAGYANVKCSVCWMFYPENSGRWNYCPECGAKMDGDMKE